MRITSVTLSSTRVCRKCSIQPISCMLCLETTYIIVHQRSLNLSNLMNTSICFFVQLYKVKSYIICCKRPLYFTPNSVNFTYQFHIEPFSF